MQQTYRMSRDAYYKNSNGISPIRSALQIAPTDCLTEEQIQTQPFCEILGRLKSRLLFPESYIDS